jgi:nitrate reductase (cytochrome), electron transfer subunit
MMARRRILSPAARWRVARIAAAVLVMTGSVALFDGVRARSADDPAPALLNRMDAPIPAEADVFRLRPDDLAAGADAEARPGARLRTLASFRGLRAYPGAPPRIPHALEAGEFMRTTCNACHESGGYSRRFGAYAPVTPHPEYRNCLQCHAADAGAVGIASLASAGAPRPGAAGEAFAGLDWKSAAWPRTGQRAMPGSPPVIPHDLHLRGNCLACHAGPSALAEIRTTHPGRANCRQCHVPGGEAAAEVGFTRPVRDGAARGDVR